jgi:putative transcriptional regulator
MAVRYQIGANMNYTGKLLVAHPMLNDFFHRAVILVYSDDNQNGTLGLVLNKPTKITVNEIVSEKGMPYAGTEHIYKGGPVNENALLMVHEDNWYASNTMPVARTGLAITSDDIMLQKLSMDNTPIQWRMCVGLAGWSPGQLQQEINSRYGWLTCDAHPSIVFAKDGERQWNRALQQCATQTIDQYL